MRRFLACAVAGAAMFLSTQSNAGQVGVASYYKSGRVTANGERFNPHGLTAAHRTLKFGTILRVTDTTTGKSVIVRVNDRGPFIRGRIIDLSLGAALALGIEDSGLAHVRLVSLTP
jgi:rare lipoprotein A